MKLIYNFMKHLNTFKLFEDNYQIIINELLCKAAMRGDIETCKKSLKDGADINYKQKDGNTPLIVSCYSGYDNLIMTIVLLEAGADPTMVDKKGDNFIDLNIQYHPDMRMWFETDTAQRLLFSKYPSLIKSFIKHNIIIDPDIRKEFYHLFTGTDLNLL